MLCKGNCNRHLLQAEEQGGFCIDCKVEAKKKKTQVHALKRRIDDMLFAVGVCIDDDKYEQEEALRSVLEVKWQFIPPKVAKEGTEAIAEYLYHEGISAND